GRPGGARPSVGVAAGCRSKIPVVMRRRLVPPLGVVLVLLVPLASARGVLAPPTVQSLAEDVATLAAPDMEGRRSGTPGGDRAARRIAEWLAAAGLRPGGAHGTYFQPLVIHRAAPLRTATRLDTPSPATRAPHG